ncbi:MAG: hypothetical protein LAT57_00020 [Balneolales bacterium]|nr:hypothetical protein [Balneolales bacterium]
MNDDDVIIEYRIKDIIVIKFNIQEHPYTVDDIFDNLELKYTTAFFSIVDMNLINFDLGITATTNIEDEKECFSIHIRYTFEINNLSRLCNDQNKVQIDDGMLSLFASLGYSSTRGILKERLAYSRYNSTFILPVVNPKDLVKNIPKDGIENNTSETD